MNIVLAVICMIIGIVGVFFPEFAWYLEHGWRYKNAEPSDTALFFNRLGGVIVIILGIVFIFWPELIMEIGYIEY